METYMTSYLFGIAMCLKCCEGFLDFIFHHPNKTSPYTRNSTAAFNQTHVDVDNESDFDPVKAEAGTIAGTVFGILLCVVFISGACVIYIRRKRERDEEYQRKAKVQLRSTQYAGVYVDMAPDVPVTSKPRHSGTGPEYNALNSRNRNDIYESDSEDELWSSKTQ